MDKSPPKPPSEMTDKELLQEWKHIDRYTDAGSRNFALARELARRKIDF